MLAKLFFPTDSEGAIDFLSINFFVGRDHETKLRSSDQS